MLEDQLDPALANVWSWDRDEKEPASDDGMWPRRELRDLM